MQVAKLTSKGQITLPKEIRTALKLKEGDRVVFMPNPQGFIVANANKLALQKLQDSFDGEAEKAGIKTDEDVMNLIKEYRKSK